MSGMNRWWSAVGRYPATWAVVALVLLAELALFSWFRPPPVLAIILIMLGLVALVVWPITMSATGVLSRLQFEAPKMAEVDPQEVADLEHELNKLADPRPAYQLRAIREKRDNLTEVLNRRLEHGELTYARYLSTAQQVYISALGNLREVAISLRTIATIDDEYIDRRLDELSKDEVGEGVDSERASLEDRRALRDSQHEKVARLLAQNESAMTSIDKTAGALADAPMGREPEDLELATAALRELAERASKYATIRTMEPAATNEGRADA